MISTVSIVGVDDSVSPTDLADISQTYPFVEWGVNLSPSVQSIPGYPSEEWLEDLLNQTDTLRLRGILQDRWLRDILNGSLSIKEENPRLWDALQRIQIDITSGYGSVLEALQLIPDKEAILVTNTPELINGSNLNAHPLLPKNKFDCASCKYYGYCGYTLKDSDIDIIVSRSDNNFWISVDGFRSDGITLDLLKIEQFLDSTEDKVTQDSWFKALLQTNKIQRRFSEPPSSPKSS